MLLLHAVTLNVAVNSHNHLLLAVLVSNNFTEVKSHIFKRFSKDNLSKVMSQGEDGVGWGEGRGVGDDLPCTVMQMHLVLLCRNLMLVHGDSDD